MRATITATPTETRILVQDPTGDRLLARLPVGRLLRTEHGYEFAYIRAVRAAQALGFLRNPSTNGVI